MIKDSNFLPKNKDQETEEEKMKAKIEVASNKFGEKEIIALEKKSLGEEWIYPDAEEYYRQALENPRHIHIFLRRGEKLEGYLHAVPHDEVAEEEDMREADPEFAKDPERYYIETMEIDPELQKTLRGGKLFFQMLHTLFDEAEKRFGVNKFSMHARVSTGMSQAVRRYFGEMITKVRRIEKWKFYNYEEPTDYMEGTYNRNREKNKPA